MQLCNSSPKQVLDRSRHLHRARRRVVAKCSSILSPPSQVLDKIKVFTEKVRSGAWVGATGKPIKDVVAVGIGAEQSKQSSCLHACLVLYMCCCSCVCLVLQTSLATLLRT